MPYSIAVDVGGTFTDLVAYDAAAGSYIAKKSLTTYEGYVGAIAHCIAKAGLRLDDANALRAGTTLVINALLQRAGARTALIATRGFGDVLEMGRGNRPRPYDLRYRRAAPLVPRNLVFEIAGRINADGSEHEPLNLDEIDRLAPRLRELGIDAVAVSFMNSYCNDAHERAAAQRLRERLPGVYVTAGVEMTREWYEYERACTAAANAYVGPRMVAYLEQVHTWLRSEGCRTPFFMMASHGGAYSTDRARREPLMLVESGPVGGCIAAAAYAELLGLRKVVAFDMGGTTAKCCVVEDGKFEVQSPYYIGGAEYGFPIRARVLDIVEVGAGGGSIAAVDGQGRLSVGPRSAGSEPGPVCYGRGGREPTITDANLALGRIAPVLAGGEMSIDAAAARSAIAERIAAPMGLSGDDAVDRAAQGVIKVGVLTMTDAIREITIQRGEDPRDFTLIAYGGGGPLHSVELARELSIPQVVIPLEPGVFSCFGMLMADGRLDEQITFLHPLNDDVLARVDEAYRAMESRLAHNIVQEIGDGEIVYERFAELKYMGQGHSMRIQIGDAQSTQRIRSVFDAAYLRRYGYANETNPLEFTQLIATATVRMHKPRIERLRRNQSPPTVAARDVFFPSHGRVRAAVYQRGSLPAGFSIDGPALIEEYGSTTVLPPEDRLQVGEYGELRIAVANAPSR